MRATFQRIVLMVLDSVGIGAMPDAESWGDAGTDTLGHVLAATRARLPNLQRLGLGNIRPIPELSPSSRPLASFGKAAIRSNGKDTTVGHWELAGVVTSTPFPIYPEGFPERVMSPFTAAIGSQVLGNRPASGTEIIKELGEEHIRTGRPIVYTSADSVFQIAAHEKVIPLKELYRICEIARRILNGPDCVARVIARPFLGAPGGFYRTGNRKDFAVEPPEPTVLDRLKKKGLKTVAVGKIASIFAYRGITEERPSKDNGEALDQTIDALHSPGNGLIFVNLVDFDMLWGHRRDVEGYAAGLESLDRRIPDLIAALGEGECLILCADHGCDPTAHGTDHTREYVPILVYEARLKGGTDLGTRETMADIGQTVADNFGLQLGHGISFLDQLA